MAEEVVTNEEPEVSETDVVQLDEEVETPAEDKKAEWDQTKQFRDELSAANRREGEIKAQLESSNDKVAQMKTELAEIKARIDSPGEETGDVDLNDYDNLVKALTKEQQESKKLRQAIDENAKQSQETQKTVKELQAQLNQRAQEERSQAGQRALDAECDRLDAKYGAENRNAVLKIVEQEFIDQDVASMSAKAQPAWITNTLKLRYIEQSAIAKSSAKKKKGSGVAVDTGTGGDTPADELPEGTFSEIAAKMTERDKRLYG